MLSAHAYCFAFSSSRAEGLMRRRRRHTARELNNMRSASLIAISGLIVQAAHADVVPNVMLGTWAETAEQCAAKDKSNIVIAPAKYGDGAGSCAVRFIVQNGIGRYELRSACALHQRIAAGENPNRQYRGTTPWPRSRGDGPIVRKFKD